MELHIQKCQHCGSRELRNILVRDEGQKVFVQCRACDKLVARYTLSPGGYFHAGKGFESFLRSIERDEGTTSGRDIDELFTHVEEKVRQEFDEIQTRINDKYRGSPR